MFAEDVEPQRGCRCLRRLDLTRVAAQVEERRIGAFEDAPCGCIDIDLKVLSKLNKQASDVFVAVDWATRHVFVALIHQRDAKTICRCLSKFIQFFPQPAHTILTDNDGAFTDRFAMFKKGKPAGKPSGTHPFDVLCDQHGIVHRLIRPYTPQTNGMVERFNRRISEALRKKKAISANTGKKQIPQPRRTQPLHPPVRGGLQ